MTSGFDVGRFESSVSDEFLCPICTDVLDDPLVTPSCEHIFCGRCIKHWLSSGPSNAEPCCPIDRTPATVDSLRAPLRSFRNLLYGQNIRCQFAPSCSVYVKLHNLADHESACNYNPVNIEKEVECENKCGAKYKMQNKDKHNCVLYLHKEMKLLEDRAAKEVERLRAAEKENGKLTRKLEDGKRKWEESRLTVRNELQQQQEMNAYLTRQLEEAHKEIVRLKGQVAVATSSGLRTRTGSLANGVSGAVAQFGGFNIHNSNNHRPRSIATSKDCGSANMTVDTALLVNFEQELSELSIGETSVASSTSNSRFYSASSGSTSTSGLAVRGTSGHLNSSSSSSEGSVSNHSASRSSEGSNTASMVRNVQGFFNRLSSPLSALPKISLSHASSSSSSSSSSSPSSVATMAASSSPVTPSAVLTSNHNFKSQPSSPPPVPPPKPPKPKPTLISISNTSPSNHHHHHQSSSSSNYANFELISNTYSPSTSSANLAPAAANGLSSSLISVNSLPPPASPSSAEHFILEHCKKQRVLQVLTMVNRRHFFPSNEYYKAAATKKGAHAFTLGYEIRLLEILESYIKSDSRVLDIGSGMGFISVCLAHLAKTVIGVEHVKSLVNKATDTVNSHYGNLSPQISGHPNKVVFFNEDGRYGLERLGPYDLILIEPLVRNNVPPVILQQLKPGGCVVAVVKTDSKLAMYRITRNEAKKTVCQTLIEDQVYLAAQHKDYLCDIRQQQGEFPILNMLKERVK